MPESPFASRAIEMGMTRMKRYVERSDDPLMKEMRRSRQLDSDRSRARRGSRDRPSR